MFESEAGRERWIARFALLALVVSLFALVITFLQWRSAERAANVAEQARIDAKEAAEKALGEAEQARVVERKDAADALEAQTKRADRANALADRSAKAAEDTAKTAVLQVEVADRPWVSIEVNIIGPFTFDANGANLPTLVTLKNSGHSPAAGLWIDGELITKEPFDPVHERERFCNQVQAQELTNPRLTNTLFLGTDYRRQWTFTSGRDNLDRLVKTRGGLIVPVLIICAVYHAAFVQTPHQSARIFWLLDARDSTNPGEALAILTDGSTAIPAQRLRLYDYMVGGSYAN